MIATITKARIRVLIVDDSAVVRELLRHILSADPQILVIGTASNGKDALSFIEHTPPDVITMDYQMPKMNGLEATRMIMKTHPIPIIIVSGTAVHEEAAKVFHLIDSGAVAIVAKPISIEHANFDAMAKELVHTVKLMSEVKVIRRWFREKIEPQPQPQKSLQDKLDVTPANIKIVVIGASTGGPIVIKTILSKIPKNFPIPILIVQHIAQGFAIGFVEWLKQTTGFSVQLAVAGTFPLPQHAYVAPDGLHMLLASNGSFILTDDAPMNGHRPSVARLFLSVATLFGRHAVGILLSGMGKDGAAELKLLKNKGALTIVQDKETSIVYGMPGEAIQLNAESLVLTPEAIACALSNLVKI